MKKYFSIQIIFLISGFLLISLFYEIGKAIDFGLGFLAVLIPNAFFAINLSILKKIVVRAEVKLVSFFLGEIIKVIFIMILLYLFSKIFYPLDWIIFIAGLFISLKATYMLPLLAKKI